MPRVLFDVQNLYYLPQFQPVERELTRRGVECRFVLHAEREMAGLLQRVVEREQLDVVWVDGQGEAAELYARERPDWVIFGHVFVPPEGFPPEIGRALVYHSVGPKTGRYHRGLKHMHVRFVESEHYLEEVRKHFPEPSIRLELTGYAKLDPLFQDDGPDRTGELERLGLDPARRTVLYAPTYFPSSIERMPRDLPGELDGLNLIVKPHFFSLNRRRYRGHRRRFERWAKAPNVRVAEPEEYSLLPFMRVADLLVSEGSSALFEFCALDRPVVVCDFHRVRFGYRGPFRARLDRRLDASTDAFRNIGVHAAHPRDVVRLVREQLDRPGDFARERRECARRLVGAIDGGASRRIVDVLLAGPPGHGPLDGS